MIVHESNILRLSIIQGFMRWWLLGKQKIYFCSSGPSTRDKHFTKYPFSSAQFLFEIFHESVFVPWVEPLILPLFMVIKS